MGSKVPVQALGIHPDPTARTPETTQATQLLPTYMCVKCRPSVLVCYAVLAPHSNRTYQE